jgi:hypothetical protein
MSSILLFPSRDAIARRRPRAQPADTGRILLFTGVRYEHWVEPEPKAGAQASRQTASGQTTPRRRAPRSHRRA